jgi:hypothetical protein
MRLRSIAALSFVLGFVVACGGGGSHGQSPASEGGAPDASGSGGSSGGGSGSSSGSTSCTGGACDAGLPSDAGMDGAKDGAGANDAMGAPDAGSDLFAGCSITGGCVADCSPPAVDPIATGTADLDLYDGCILAGMQVANMTQAWQGKLLKSQAYNESGITPVVTTNDNTCGGQNCGNWAISAGSVSGDSPPGPCGSSASDKFTGMVDYSHSYGLFQSTPACDGVFALTKTLPTGDTCTGTTEANNIPFGTSIDFYCESETSNAYGSYIDAVQDTTSPLYALSAFNPAYQIYVYFAQWASNFQQANASASGCTMIEQWYLTLAYWLTGDASTSCTLSDQTGSGGGQDYVLTIIQDYDMLYNATWPYPSP